MIKTTLCLKKFFDSINVTQQDVIKLPKKIDKYKAFCQTCEERWDCPIFPIIKDTNESPNTYPAHGLIAHKVLGLSIGNNKKTPLYHKNHEVSFQKDKFKKEEFSGRGGTIR